MSRRDHPASDLHRHLTHAPAAPRRLPSRRNVVAGIVVLAAVALAVFSLAGVDRGAVADALAGADPRLLALAIAAYAIGQTLSGVMWMRCLDAGGVRGMSVGTGLGMHWVARAACELLPMSLGEAVRVALVRRHPGGRHAGSWKITGGLAGYKIIDGVVTAVVVLTIAMATPMPGPAGGLRWSAVGFIACIGVLALVWRFTNLGALVGRAPARIRDVGTRLTTGAGVLKNPRAAGSASLLGLGAAIARVVSLGALLAAFGISPAAAGLVFCVIVIAGIVPGAPGGAGARELILVPALALAQGVSSADALAFSVGIQAIALATSLVLGLAALAIVGPGLRARGAADPVAWAPLAPPPPAALQRAPA